MTEIKKIEGFTPGPWRECGHDRGGCSCGNIWSIPLDFHLATAELENETNIITKEQATANASLIAYAPELYSIALEQQKEIARLKGLIESAHKCGWMDGRGYGQQNVTLPESLEKFKTDNQL